ncbi:G-type lectin S-receptor-like serine/threonine-protein kinase SD2-5 [Canna indica]|uniref:non-specific serine/threonine protein kinase n=1 Tax=Canna indica TaxID=4628 RepID=A0AAQ3QIQ9_9LILI|nr:G-type lectin S-receptor-like serine/threonine-protein kinase SD2-5 [Canna indica]
MWGGTGDAPASVAPAYPAHEHRNAPACGCVDTYVLRMLAQEDADAWSPACLVRSTRALALIAAWPAPLAKRGRPSQPALTPNSEVNPSPVGSPVLPATLSAMPSVHSSCSLQRYLLLLLHLAILSILHAQYDYPSANLSTVWTNNRLLLPRTNFTVGIEVRVLLLRISPKLYGPTYACGFFCTAGCNAFLFAVFALYTNSGAIITNQDTAPPQVVWSANRDHPVRANATLHLTAGGDLILSDVDGTVVWSTGTSGRSVVGMNITESGNLVLFDQNGTLVWQSFDYPTDSLVLGQTLSEGQMLTTNVSMTNWTQSNIYYLTILSDGLYAFADSGPPKPYYRYTIFRDETTKRSTYMKYVNGSLDLFVISTNSTEPDGNIWLTPVTPESTIQFMRLEYDGHLRTYGYNQGWQVMDDVLALDVCDYPTVCGTYGLCSNGECSCPRGENESAIFLEAVDAKQASLGCSLVTPLSCQSMQEHHLLTAHNVSHFSYRDSTFQDIDVESCKQACLKNCSCKASLFLYGSDVSTGSCLLLTRVLSLQNNQPSISHYNSTAFIKVQLPASPTPNSPSRSKRKGIILGIVGGGIAALVIGGLAIVFVRRKKASRGEEDDLHKVYGMPMRFSYEELRSATKDFSKKLGRGGFAVVYEGKIDGESVAVKFLNDQNGQGKRPEKKVLSKKKEGREKKDFIAEVKTIGSVHHVNLVRLIGFCNEKSERLLVYEYMCNGSLDKWIYNNADQIGSLKWETRCKIITGIAKGLSYLHELCRQKIAHLDIKPQNILLDDKLRPKISDFGLAKLIDRDKDQVTMGSGGTIGYMAPERRSSPEITEKVDTYSFGVVVIEIVCGRKNLDHSQSEDSFHLLGLLQEMTRSDRLEDFMDSHGNDVQLHRQEAIEKIKLAVWCLQGDPDQRPSMSTVVNVLEGVAENPPSTVPRGSNLHPSSHPTAITSSSTNPSSTYTPRLALDFAAVTSSSSSSSREGGGDGDGDSDNDLLLENPPATTATAAKSRARGGV